jgi:hypothetical protein
VSHRARWSQCLSNACSKPRAREPEPGRPRDCDCQTVHRFRAAPRQLRAFGVSSGVCPDSSCRLAPVVEARHPDSATNQYRGTGLLTPNEGSFRMEANCLSRQQSTIATVLVVLVVIVILVRLGFKAGDVHQLLIDLTGLVSLAIGVHCLAVPEMKGEPGR